MSAEPPPPDWVRSDAAFHDRRSILDGKDTRRARSRARVILEPVPRASVLDWAEPEEAGARDPHVEAQRAATASLGAAWLAGVRQEWDDYAFTTLRRSQLVAVAGFVTVLALAAYGWQRGTLSGMTAEVSGDLISAGATPAAPRLSSDQVEWTDTWDGESGDARRSTASFSSDRAVADGADHEPRSGAKLFVADGKKSSKGGTAKDGDKGAATETAEDPLRNAATGSGSQGPSAAGPTTRNRTETTSVTTVRYESCAEAAAAGAAPIRLGEPGYRLSLDRDKDGVACENGSTAEDPGDAPVDSLYSNPTTTVNPSGSTTTVSSTGAGTTSTVDSTTTSTSSTTGSTATSSTTESSRTTSTTMSTTGSTSTTTSTVPTTTSTTATSTTSSTTSTTPSTTAPSTTSSTTVSTTTSSTPSITAGPPPTDPIRAPGTRRSGLGLV